MAKIDDKSKAPTDAESLDTLKPDESLDAPVDMAALKAKIRAEAEAEIRAEIVERKKAEDERQAELDAQNSELDEVVCMIENVHTSKGKMLKGATKNLPKAEADELVAQRKVKRT